MDHPELDEGTSSKIDTSARGEQGARVPKTSIRVKVISPRDEQCAHVPKTSIRVKFMSPRDDQGACVPKTSIRAKVMSPRDEQGACVSKTSIRVKVMSTRDEQGARVPKTSLRSIVLLCPVCVLRARHVYGDKICMYKKKWFVRSWTWMERIYKLLFMERNLCKHRHGFGAWGVM
uniref:Uncharacterized protein n=1 Tax=Lepeophtheirus salmonis TaxID=72036 RepID=A0A0K2URF7_LEPSM